MEDRKDYIQRLYEDLLVKPQQVYSIFVDYFGEGRVDLQNIELEKLAELTNDSLFLLKVNSYLETRGLEYSDWEKVKHKCLKDLTEEEFTTFKDIILEYFYNTTTECDPYIIIYFGDITVTNEYGKSIDIQGLWVKVSVSFNGTAEYFALNRSEYTPEQFNSDYMHSHVSGINTTDFSRFEKPCYGSGPIRNTLLNLINGFDELIWQLFCFELDKYVHVESIAGTPFRRLENVSRYVEVSEPDDFSMVLTDAQSITSNEFTVVVLEGFLSYLIHGKKLKFNYFNGSYGLAMGYTDFLIFISNEFISWYNSTHSDTASSTAEMRRLERHQILVKCKVRNGRIYYPASVSNNSEWSIHVGSFICRFKGAPIHLKVRESNQKDDNFITILRTDFAQTILKKILGFINLNYAKPTKRLPMENSGSSDTPFQRLWYI